MPQVQQKMNTVVISNQVFGGVSDTKYLGIKDSVHKMVGFDIHSEPGVQKVNQGTVKISSTTIDGLIRKSVVCSNGETYCFSGDSGKIWRIKSDNATVELCYTTVPGAGNGEAKCLDAKEYNGYVVWSTELKVHRIAIALAKSETSWTSVEGRNGINTTTLNAGGSGYVAFDTFTVDGGGILATGTVLTVNAGAVLTYSIDTVGSGYSIANAVTTTKTTGAGTGFKINITGLGSGFKSFTNGDKLYHPMEEQNGVLYIGDGYILAQLDGETWSPNALDLPYPTQHRISALMKYLTTILTGTFVNSNVISAIVALWNTWSVSFTYQDELPENGVNSFLKTDNYVVASIGKKGNFYLFNGQSMDQYKRIPGNWGGVLGPNQAISHPDAQINVNGLPMFGISNVYGNPVDQGVWSLGSYSREYPKVLNLEYVISTGNVANVEIGSVFMAGTDLFICWKDSNGIGGASSYGIDKVDTTKKAATAYFDTRVIASDRTNEKEFSISICYRVLPTGTNIKLYADKNDGNGYVEQVLLPDARKMRFYSKVKCKGVAVQFRVKAISYQNVAPELETTIITFP